MRNCMELIAALADLLRGLTSRLASPEGARQTITYIKEAVARTVLLTLRHPQL